MTEKRDLAMEVDYLAGALSVHEQLLVLLVAQLGSQGAREASALQAAFRDLRHEYVEHRLANDPSFNQGREEALDVLSKAILGNTDSP